MKTNFDLQCEQILLSLDESQFPGIVGAASDAIGSAGNILKRFMNTELYQIATGIDPTRLSSIPEAINAGYEFYKKPSVLGAVLFLLSAYSASPLGGQALQIIRGPQVIMKMLSIPLLLGDIIVNRKSIVELLQKESKEPAVMNKLVNSAIGYITGAKPRIDQQARQLDAEVKQQSGQRGRITVTPATGKP